LICGGLYPKNTEALSALFSCNQGGSVNEEMLCLFHPNAGEQAMNRDLPSEIRKKHPIGLPD
jgi:hypothetical protein